MRQRHAANNGKKAEESRLAGMQRPMRGFIEDRERDGGHAHLNKLMAQSFGANVAPRHRGCAAHRPATVARTTHSNGPR